MQRRIVLLVFLILVAFLLWKTSDKNAGLEPSDRTGRRATDTEDLSAAETAEGHASLPTKATQRKPASAKATHGPQRLKEFFLPVIEINGLTLQAALQKLKAAYEDACRETGETPLQLTFNVPAGKDKALRLKLASRNLEASIRMLAAASGLTVKREGSAYHFEEPAALAGMSKKSFRVPPDLEAKLRESGGDLSNSGEFRDLFEAMGLDLDASTTISFDAKTGTVQLGTESAADMTAVAGITDLVSNDMPIQQKMETKIFELPTGMEWNPPDPAAHYSDAQIQLMMREIAQINGIDLMTAPSVTARNGEAAKIEIIRELITPTDDSGENFETHNLGHVFDLQGSALGFGQRMNVNYTDTVGGADPVTGKAQISTHTDIKNTSYVGDGSTKLYVQTRPDGTRTVLMVTPTMIDATGRPLREQP